MEADEITSNLYVRTPVIAAISLGKYEAADALRKTFQEEVFCPSIEISKFQKHFNLLPGSVSITMPCKYGYKAYT